MRLSTGENVRCLTRDVDAPGQHSLGLPTGTEGAVRQVENRNGLRVLECHFEGKPPYERETVGDNALARSLR
jgi:hypothetical protein